jgi:hypothetical protein
VPIDRGEFDASTRLPPHQLEAAAAHRRARGLARAQRATRDGADEVRRQRHDERRGEELLGRAGVEAERDVQRVDRGHLADGRRRGDQRGSVGRVADDREAGDHVDRAHRRAVMPACIGVQRERDGERIGAPAPALRELRREAQVADGAQRRSHLSEPIEQELGDDPSLLAVHERHEQGIGVHRGADDDRAALAR